MSKWHNRILLFYLIAQYIILYFDQPIWPMPRLGNLILTLPILSQIFNEFYLNFSVCFFKCYHIYQFILSHIKSCS